MTIKEAVKKAKNPNASACGEVLKMICGAVPGAREIVEADLDNESMGLDALFEEIRSYARKNQKGGFWGCPVFGFDPNNKIIRLTLDFYKIDADGAAAAEAPAEAAPTPVEPAAADGFDLMGLL